jgi:hypothetical protein
MNGSKTRTALIAVLRQLNTLAHALASEEPEPPPAASSLPVFVSRRSAKEKIGCDTRVFNRAMRDLGAVRPGRDLLIRSDALIAWIEAQRVAEEGIQEPKDKDAPLDFATFRRSVERRKRAAG